MTCNSPCPFGDPTCSDLVSGRNSLLELQCSGFNVDRSPMTNGQIQSFWNDNGNICRSEYQNIIYTKDDKLEFNPDGYKRVSQDLYYLLNTVFGEDAVSFSPTLNIGLQQQMYSTCSDDFHIMGACDPWINCVLLPNNNDYQLMANNPALTDWLGCYVKPTNGDELYGDLGISVIPDNKRGINPCWTLCHRASSIQLFSPDDGDMYECDSNICVIDNVVINESQSDIGSANITQVCTQCSPDQLCQCIISSNDMPGTFQELGINSSFTSFCDNGICYELEPDGTLESVECSTYVGGGSGNSYSSSLPWIIFLIALFVFLIFLGVFLALKKPKYIKEVPTNFVVPGDGTNDIHSWDLK